MIGAGDMAEALMAEGDQNKDSKIDFDGEYGGYIAAVVYNYYGISIYRHRNRSKHVLISVYFRVDRHDERY